MNKVLIDSDHAHDARENAPNGTATGTDAAWLALVADKVRSLNYGVVQIVVHDSRVVQVERTERHRFDVPRDS